MLRGKIKSLKHKLNERFEAEADKKVAEASKKKVGTKKSKKEKK